MTHRDLNVSRETLTLFRHYEELVLKWNSSINLISEASLKNFYNHHIADGVLTTTACQKPGHWIDLGSGGGIPGIVVAIMERGRRVVTLVESDQRKCAFLSTVRRELGLDCIIRNDRIEDVDDIQGNVVSARALAPLPELLALATPLCCDETELLLPKGRNWQREEHAARKHWDYDLEVFDSLNGNGSVVLRLQNLKRIE